jgi:hypothetical protein
MEGERPMTYTPSAHTQAQALLSRAQWHRAESKNFLRHSVAAMYQLEREAEDLEQRAAQLLNKAKEMNQ